jgi:hypothetical protein
MEVGSPLFVKQMGFAHGINDRDARELAGIVLALMIASPPTR